MILEEPLPIGCMHRIELVVSILYLFALELHLTNTCFRFFSKRIIFLCFHYLFTYLFICVCVGGCMCATVLLCRLEDNLLEPALSLYNMGFSVALRS